jgi:peptidase E
MKTIAKQFIVIALTMLCLQAKGQGTIIDKALAKDKIIFVTGGNFDQTYIRYLAKLTGKPNPKIGFIATATGDHPNAIVNWYVTCEDLPLRPYFIRTYIQSSRAPQTFEEIIMGMDAIVVSGGNTLNMLAIWKAQGIDSVLRKAYDHGIILAGGSAGSLCWFEGGSTDSRPKELTIVEGLGLLNFSHSPHYLREPSRKPLYHQLLLNNMLKPGYACDDAAGLLFVNGKVSKSVSLNTENKNYFVSVKDGKVIEEVIAAEILK